MTSRGLVRPFPHVDSLFCHKMTVCLPLRLVTHVSVGTLQHLLQYRIYMHPGMYNSVLPLTKYLEQKGCCCACDTIAFGKPPQGLGLDPQAHMYMK